MIENIGINGQWSCTITRANGDLESFKQPNAIHTNLKETITDALNSADANFSCGSNFHGNDGSGQGSNSSSLTGMGAGTAGISMSLSGLSGYYGMDSSVETNATSNGSSGYYCEWRGTIRVTQSYTVTAIFLGRNASGSTGAFNTIYATGSNWSNVALGDGDQMDIVWKVTIS